MPGVEIYDVIVVGAGLSGIGAAYHLQTGCPEKTFIVLEARSGMGGTWDLFKYPGIRSDSDMYTMGFSFNPWESTKSLADGPSILQYIKDTAKKFGIDKKILYNHKVTDASWDTIEKVWTLTIQPNEKTIHQQLKCKFLMMCSGYYDYDNGYTPEFTGREIFNGTIIHPQHWNQSVNYENKKVIIIGSGATAITLAPNIAAKAEKVFMVQRSPTYVLSLPGEDKIAGFFKKIFPRRFAYQMSRWKNIFFTFGFYSASRKWPSMVKRFIRNRIKKELGAGYDMKNFEPDYQPWDQRLCIVPDADLFRSIKSGKVEIITDTIKQFSNKGILLHSGRELDADLIITATGLKMQMLGGMTLHVDNELINTSKKHCYRGVMFDDVPNFAITVGYANASWTLKCDLNCQFVVKVLNYMDRKKYEICTARFDSTKFGSEPFLDIQSGYIRRAADILPKQGSKHPWKVYQNYFRDLLSLRIEKAEDKYLEYK